jgi:osmotically-inducible protein OsmY
MRAFVGALVALTLMAGSPFLADAGKAEDAKITSKVKTKLTSERVKNLVSVNVDTKDGVVHLKGTVPNEQAKAEAERLAKDTEGVVSVTNDLKVSASKDSSPATSPSKTR